LVDQANHIKGAKIDDVRKWVDGADVFSDRSQPHGVGLHLIKVNGS
jgi:hypothetical protein